MRHQNGQTLIETVIGIFILVMGITASVGLAAYSLNSTASVTKELVATGLAREGIEAVRNMRDTNWLQDTLAINGCYSYVTSQNNAANCYKNWDKSALYDIKGTPTDKIFSLDFNPAATDSSPYWNLNVTGGSANYGINFDAGATSGRFYSAANAASGNSEYYRKIVITRETPAPYQNPDFVRLKIRSMVWWQGKGCPVVTDYTNTTTTAPCFISLTTYLTNWKNY